MTPEDRDEIKRHFDVVADGLRSDIRFLAEGVAVNGERLERVEGEVHALRDETRQGFTELRSQIRLSYS